MKRCPNCYKTFADSLRFCQVDGTALIDETEDDYKTTVGAAPFDDDDDLLQLSDDTATVVSPNNSGRASSTFDANRGDEPDDLLSFGNPTVPIFAPSETSYQPPPYNEPPAKEFDSSFGSGQSAFDQNPFEQNQGGFSQQQQMPQQWTPPPAPEAGWQSQNIGANTPFQPPPTMQGPNQTLPVISLVSGVLAFVLICCYGGFPFGIAALVTGFLGFQNVTKDPVNYSGKGLAIAGMILGGVSFVLGVVFLIIGGALSLFKG